MDQGSLDDQAKQRTQIYKCTFLLLSHCFRKLRATGYTRKFLFFLFLFDTRLFILFSYFIFIFFANRLGNIVFPTKRFLFALGFSAWAKFSLELFRIFPCFSIELVARADEQNNYFYTSLETIISFNNNQLTHF